MKADALDQIRERRRKLQAELAELDVAERVLSTLSNGKPTRRPSRRRRGAAIKALLPGGKSYSGMKIITCAAEILKEAGADMHYSEVAEKALAGGYTTGRSGSTDESIRKSFWHTMKRNPEYFEPAGKGRFRLKL